MKLELSQKNIAGLENETLAPCITIYLPLSKTFREKSAKDKVEFENLIKTAAKIMISSGSEPSYAAQAVEPLKAASQNLSFWKTAAAGIAVFTAPPGILRYFELPLAPKKSIFVGKGFDLARLKKILDFRREFFVLAASKNNLGFYSAKNGAMEKIILPGMPKNINELKQDKAFEKNLQSHGRSPLGKSEIFHGQGQKKENEKIILQKYFQKASLPLNRFLAKKNAPLIFAGTDSIFSIFRQTNHYSNLFEKNLRGNFDKVAPEIIFQKAGALLKRAGR